jgi:hypothetical protein
MIGKTILHYKILEKLGEALIRFSLYTEVGKTKACFVGQGGPAPVATIKKLRIIMIGDTILHYKIIEKLGEARLDQQEGNLNYE